jgi:hypothetical protein
MPRNFGDEVGGNQMDARQTASLIETIFFEVGDEDPPAAGLPD